MIAHLRPSLVLLVLLTLITGLAYPLAVTGFAQAVVPVAANGSLIVVNGTAIGSSLVGQRFASDRFFNGRPSAAGSDGYDASASSGSNLGPSSKTLAEAIRQRADSLGLHPAPADLVTASASGLDPDLSPAAALAQVQRVAAARGRTPEEIRTLVMQHIAGRDLGVLGEPRVNVLRLNLALDALKP